MRQRTVAVAAMLAALGIAGPTAGATSAEPLEEPGTGTLHGLDVVMEKLKPVRRLPGFGSAVVNEPDSSLEVFWKGTPPSQALELRQIAPTHGVDLQLRSADYSASELDTASDLVKATAEAEGLPLVAISRAADSSGLSVEVVTDPDSPQGELATTADILDSRLSVPVKVKAGALPINRDRFDMIPAYKGGGTLSIPRDGAVGTCTAGFPVIRNGVGYLLSAGHCAPYGDPPWIRNGAQTSTLTNHPDDVHVHGYLDSLLIDPDPSPATDGILFHGGLNTNAKISVGGWGPPTVGERVCVSGGNTAATGANCNLAVIYEETEFECGAFGNYNWCPGFRARSTAWPPRVIGGAGDSGSPVYLERSDGRAGARGIYVSGVPGFQDWCEAIRGTNGPYACDTRINVVGIEPLMTYWRVTPELN